MKLFQVAVRSTCGNLRHQWRHLSCIRRLSTFPASGNGANDEMNYNSYESEQDFSQRISGNGANNKMNSNPYESERDFSQRISGNGNRRNYNSYESERDFSQRISGNGANNKMNYNSYESGRDFSQQFSGNGANNRRNYNSYESERDFSQRISGNGANNKMNYNSYESGRDFSQQFSGNGANNKMNYNSYESGRNFSREISGNGANHNMSYNSYGSEQRIFGDYSGNNPEDNSFFGSIDKLKRERNNAFGHQLTNEGDEYVDDLDESFDTLSDGMEGKLKDAAKVYFEVDHDEIENGDGYYAFRPDIKVDNGSTYDIKDLDLREPSVSNPPLPEKFEVTTAEVLRKADFRNVRFLSNFLTDAGIIIKRSSTKISAKAQRKVAREIKTARAFGLMPFTTMGQYKFTFGKSRDPDLTDDSDDENDGEVEYYVPDEGFVNEGLVEPEEDPIMP